MRTYYASAEFAEAARVHREKRRQLQLARQGARMQWSEVCVELGWSLGKLLRMEQSMKPFDPAEYATLMELYAQRSRAQD